MTKEREALKLALAALEKYQTKRQDFDRFADEIIAIKEALALTSTTCEVQPEERNFCPRCGKLLMSALGPVSLHTCCPPTAPTGWNNGLSQDYDKKLGAWFSEKPNAKEELRARTFDDYGNKIV